MELGFVGLGDQGGPIPYRLLEAGHGVSLWARRSDVLEPYVNAGAKIAPDLKSLAEACDWIGVCVFDDAGVIEVCSAIMPHMRPGGSISVHSTVHPDTCRKLGKEAEASGLMLLDAPVSGGSVGARSGTLTIMVGSSPEAFARSHDIFAAYGSVIVRLGDVGAGQTAKLTNNMLMAAHVGLGHRALMAGERLGLEHEALVAVINASSGRSFGFSTIGAIGLSEFTRAAGILAKDVALFDECLAPSDPVRPYVELTKQFLDDAQTDADRLS